MYPERGPRYSQRQTTYLDFVSLDDWVQFARGIHQCPDPLLSLPTPIVACTGNPSPHQRAVNPVIRIRSFASDADDHVGQNYERSCQSGCVRQVEGPLQSHRKSAQTAVHDDEKKWIFVFDWVRFPYCWCSARVSVDLAPSGLCSTSPGIAIGLVEPSGGKRWMGKIDEVVMHFVLGPFEAFVE